MQLKKYSIVFVIIALVFAFAALGGLWSQSSAQTTIPTEAPPTARPGEGGPAEPGDKPDYCVSGPLKPGTELDLYLPIEKNLPDLVWAGVDTYGSSSCEQAIKQLCKIPVNQLPKREQLFFYRMGMEARQFINGRLDDTPACGPRQVYFELTRYERLMLDDYPDKVGIFHYNPETKTWTEVASTLDEKFGDHGRLVGESDAWGYYALGWPSGK